MNIMLTIKDFICAYWGLIPIVFILITIGVLKLPFITHLWNKEGSARQTADGSEQATQPDRSQFNRILSELRAEINDFVSAIDDIKQGRNTIQTMAKYISKTDTDIK